MQKELSIITIVFNAEDVLEKTIRSVLSQTFDDWEYILIDGGSTDSTLQIIDKYRSHLAQVISEPDSGIYDAMNKGLNLAQGKYVWFLNAGDVIYSDDTLAKIMETANDADVLYGDTEIVDQYDNKIGLRRHRPPENLTWKSFQMGMLVSHQAIIVRKSLARKYDLTYKISADIDWVIDVLKKSNKIINTHQVFVKYQQQGFSRKNIPRSLKERFMIMSKYYGLLPTLFNHIIITFRFLYFFLRNRWF